jgi:hypothetical protein
MVVVGQRFAYRERAHTPGTPIRPVEVAKEGPPRSQMIKVRWLDGEYEGLQEWVPKARLIARWEQAEALLEDELRMFAALETSGDAYDTALWKTVETVFLSLLRLQLPGEEFSLSHKAIERELLVIENLPATATRLGLDAEVLLAEPYAYIDRFGDYKAPFPVAVRVAQHCCRRFTWEVLHHIKAEEDSIRRAVISGYYAWPHLKGEVSEVGREWAEEKLKDQESVFALIREWCGQEAVDEFDQVIALRSEVDRLRKLAQETARWLRDAGHPVKAARLLKELD